MNANETGEGIPLIDRDSAPEIEDSNQEATEAAFAGAQANETINRGHIASVVLAGRTNVGKSTLFNRLTGSRDAIEGTTPELTRDRHYGSMKLSEEQRCLLIDTGGFAGDSPDFAALVEHQAKLAIADADLVALVVDARAGLTTDDQEVADYLRRQGRPTLVVVNKVDGPEARRGDQDFHALGLPAMTYVSALHGRGMASLREEVRRLLPPPAEALPETEEDSQSSIAIAGRPNAGKSTIVNRLCGEERLLVSETPGTTRDSIDVAVTFAGRQYNLIDTAGVRRRSGGDPVEDQSIVRSLRAIHRSRAVLLVVDAAEGIRYQDMHLLDHALDSGRAVVVALNKWDLISRDKRNALLADGREQLRFAATIPLVPLSARAGRGIREIFANIDRALASAVAEIPTPKLTRLLTAAVMANPPPAVAVGRRRLRPALRYAHQGGKSPPVVVIHGHRAERTAPHWRRYLRNFLSQRLGLVGVSLGLQFHGDKVPLARRQPYSAGSSAGRRRSSVRKEASKGN